MYKKRYLVTVLILLTFLTSCSLFPSEEETLTPPLVIPEDITYKTVDTKLGYIESCIKGSASFVPSGEKNLFFKNNSGRLQQLYAQVGDSVKQGDVIAQLLTDNVEREIAVAQIAVNSKQTDLECASSIADIEIRMAEDELKILETEYASMLEISGSYSENEIESTQNKLQSQKSIVEKLKLNWSNQLALKKSDLETAQLTLKGLNEDLENSKLLSPIDGIVTYTASLKEGEFVDAYLTVATIAQPEALQIKYKGLDAAKFELGMTVDVETDFGECTGEVVLTESSVPFDEAEKYADTVLIKPDKIPEGVKRGSQADIKLVLDSSDNALIIPLSTVETYMGKKMVYVLEENVRVERYVEIGIQSTNEIEILEGLQIGEKVVIE